MEDDLEGTSMTAPPVPENETERLAALTALRILGTERTAEFDIFVDLASHLFTVPIAAISLVDKDRQWFKASVGLDVTEVSRDMSFCAHAILNPKETLCVPDATLDPRFCDNTLVTGAFGLRFYAGAPIIGPSGDVMGALCVIDKFPHKFDRAMMVQLEKLKQLALGVGGALKLHASVEEFRNLAMTDSLTGLANRVAFDRNLVEACARHGTGPAAGFSLLFLDLDGFKSINDLFGHGGGDEVLRETARRLRKVMRSQDICFRFDGDEFCILAAGVQDLTALNLIAARIHTTLAEPFIIERQVVPLSTSIGVAVYSGDAASAKTVVGKADAALYEAKRAGRGTTRLANPHKADAAMSPGRDEMREQLRQALLTPGQEPFALAVQPIFQSQNGRLSGFEALVRWPDGFGHVRQPGDFIPLAETMGVIMQIDHWVLDKACKLAAGWPDHLEISCNFSAANFFAGDLVKTVSSALKRHKLAPKRLKIEVTESVLICDPAKMHAIIDGLHDLGVRIILDDFGTGFASLSYLRDYAFDGLKIDRSFIANIEANPRGQAFVRGILELARIIGVPLTVEGIETPGQLRMIRKAGTPSLQGYLLGRPMNPENAAELIRDPSVPLWEITHRIPPVAARAGILETATI
jgi:diguanylate cyclase (GGDEF)-like protein